ALVLVDDGEIDDVALLRRETRLLGNAPERAVGLERRRALGEDAVQVGHEAPGLLDAVQDLGRGSRRSGSFVKRESVDHLSSPLLSTKAIAAPSSIPRRGGRCGGAISSIPARNGPLCDKSARRFRRDPFPGKR